MTLNQCDGCRRGLPVIDGMHDAGTRARGAVLDGWPTDTMACTRDRYREHEAAHAEMLAALRGFVAAYDAKMTAGPAGVRDALSFHAQAEEARAAIARAEGR